MKPRTVSLDHASADWKGEKGSGVTDENQGGWLVSNAGCDLFGGSRSKRIFPAIGESARIARFKNRCHTWPVTISFGDRSRPIFPLTTATIPPEGKRMVSGLIGNEVLRKELRVRVPCPPLVRTPSHEGALSHLDS